MLQETNFGKVYVTAAARAVRYECKVQNMEEGRIVKDVFSAIGKEVNVMSRWTDARKRMYERAGMSIMQVAWEKSQEMKVDMHVIERLEEVDQQERQSCIDGSQYNAGYGNP